MTADILTAGHIKFLEQIRERYKHPQIIIGLLSVKALRGYKKTIVPYEDREYILKNLKQVDEVVKQDDLNPYSNLIKTRAMAIASGAGWEKRELKAIEKWIRYHRKAKEKIEKEVGEKMEDRMWKPHTLNIKLKGEGKKKLYSSSAIKKLCKELY